MNNPSANQNDPNTAIEARIRTTRILWIALLLSLGNFFVFTILKKSEDVTPNPTLSLILLGIGISTTLISFLVRNILLTRALNQQQPPLVQQAYVAGWAVNEVAGLLGVADYFVTGHRHYYILIAFSALGLLLQYPRREHILNAAGSEF